MLFLSQRAALQSSAWTSRGGLLTCSCDGYPFRMRSVLAVVSGPFRPPPFGEVVWTEGWSSRVRPGAEAIRVARGLVPSRWPSVSPGGRCVGCAVSTGTVTDMASTSWCPARKSRTTATGAREGARRDRLAVAPAVGRPVRLPWAGGPRPAAGDAEPESSGSYRALGGRLQGCPPLAQRQRSPRCCAISRSRPAFTGRPSAPAPGCSARPRSARRTPPAGRARTATPPTASA